jgi:mannitol-1-phosphate/altronate dehydrogenase
MTTAIPSVDFYTSGKNSIVSLLAENINPAKQQILYASENNNFAAEIITEQIKKISGAEKLKNFQALNTVIGKMSGVIQDQETIRELDLDTITKESSYAVLVEEFNAIIVSKILLPGFTKGIDVFVEKDDLLPFEEAKLFGHNAVHSMLGFFAYLKGYKYMSEIKNDEQLWKYGETAFEKESGAFLLKKYKHLDEPLFTPEGFAFYGEDLLERMVNPYLRDEVQRICRDPLRKLGYGDRLVGTMREALKQDVAASTIAEGVLGGIAFLIKEKADIGVELPRDVSLLDKNEVVKILKHIWKNESDDGLKDKCLEIITAQCDKFKALAG